MFIFLLLSLSLFGLNARLSLVKKWRAYANCLVMPLQEIAATPSALYHTIVNDLSSRANLLAVNATLSARNLLLKANLHHLLTLKSENTQLRALLGSSSQMAGKLLVSRLIAVDLDPALKQIVLNHGEHSHVYVGQPVLDAYGVMGQVTRVNWFTSAALLLTDVRSAIPVEDYRNKLRAIAVGTGMHTLRVIHLPRPVSVKPGDLFVASGMGMRFPAGYPVGVVRSVTYPPGARFADVILVPSAHMTRSRQLLLVWPTEMRWRDSVMKLLYAAHQHSKQDQS